MPLGKGSGAVTSGKAGVESAATSLGAVVAAAAGGAALLVVSGAIEGANSVPTGARDG